MLVPASLPLSGSELYGGLFWPIYAIWIVAETFVLSRRRAARVAAASRDRGSIRLLRLTLFLAILALFISATRIQQAAFPAGRPALFYAGLTLMVAGLALRWWAVRELGRFFTFDVAIHAGQHVVQAGPYRLVRHPAYTGNLLTLFGIGLALGNWLGLALMLTLVGAGYGFRIRVEEAALVLALGEPYRAYMARTWRLVPLVV